MPNQSKKEFWKFGWIFRKHLKWNQHSWNRPTRWRWNGVFFTRVFHFMSLSGMGQGFLYSSSTCHVRWVKVYSLKKSPPPSISDGAPLIYLLVHTSVDHFPTPNMCSLQCIHTRLRYSRVIHSHLHTAYYNPRHNDYHMGDPCFWLHGLESLEWVAGNDELKKKKTKTYSKFKGTFSCTCFTEPNLKIVGRMFYWTM